MIPSTDNLIPDIKQVDNYISVVEFLVGRVQTDCNLGLLPPQFFNQLLKVQDEVRNLRFVYINSLKFQSYE